jgi:hypothetical protein
MRRNGSGTRSSRTSEANSIREVGLVERPPPPRRSLAVRVGLP